MNPERPADSSWLQAMPTAPKIPEREPDHGIGDACGGRPDEPVVFFDRTAVETLLAGFQEEFPRPPTRFNRVIAALARRLPQRTLTAANLRRWFEDSVEVFSHIVEDPAVLDRIRHETAWVVSDDTPPDPDVWSGECKFAGGKLPVVVCYRQTLASRLPGSAHDIAWQGSMDHFVGHLYPFFQGAADPREYDENVACRYQHLAARHRARRDYRFRLIAWLMPLTYRLHKNIPLSNYDRAPRAGAAA